MNHVMKVFSSQHSNSDKLLFICDKHFFFIWNRLKFIVMNFEGKCEMKKEKKKDREERK